ncbi:LPS-assembly lipoprotein LptE [Stutzerimonas tarimensis]|uniref:LPS-assembly lipoprotein LptE n=1 Tax=Stutzerimonas tarimensis TaxID=1507735 RepID=A0ABV7TB85_9GAMM
MIKRNLAVVGLALLLSACGFQLRGNGGGEQFALRELDVQARNTYGEPVRVLEEMLQSGGLRLHPGADYTLHLVREQSRQRTASYTSSARTAEYEITSSIDYQFLDRNKLLLLEDRVEVQKVFVHDASNLAGSGQEVDQLRAEMRRELLQQLVVRLQRITPEQLDGLRQTAEARARAEAEAREALSRETAAPLQSPIQIPMR